MTPFRASADFLVDGQLSIRHNEKSQEPVAVWIGVRIAVEKERHVMRRIHYGERRRPETRGIEPEALDAPWPLDDLDEGLGGQPLRRQFDQ